MREKETFRPTLERIDKQFPDAELLNVSQVAKYLGKRNDIVSEMFAKDFIIVGKSKCISKVTLAMKIS